MIRSVFAFLRPSDKNLIFFYHTMFSVSIEGFYERCGQVSFFKIFNTVRSYALLILHFTLIALF